MEWWSEDEAAEDEMYLDAEAIKDINREQHFRDRKGRGGSFCIFSPKLTVFLGKRLMPPQHRRGDRSYRYWCRIGQQAELDREKWHRYRSQAKRDLQLTQLSEFAGMPRLKKSGRW